MPNYDWEAGSVRRDAVGGGGGGLRGTLKTSRREPPIVLCIVGGFVVGINIYGLKVQLIWYCW